MFIGNGWYIFQFSDAALLASISRGTRNNDEKFLERVKIVLKLVFKMLPNKNLSPNVALKRKILNGKFLKKNENISKEYSLSIKTFLHILAKFCTKRHADWHTQVNPSCYLVLNFKVFPHI